MATKLSQILAISSGRKSQVEKKFGDVYQLLQKAELLGGLSRTYQPLSEEGEKFPSESKRLQVRVRDTNQEVRTALTDLFDITITQDSANCQAKANIEVDGKVVAAQVPVTTLLFLEKKLTDLFTYVEKIPTLDPAYAWQYDQNQDCYATSPVQTAKTKKIAKPFVKYEHTKEHPAQVDVVTEDVLVGYWTQIQYSGAMPTQERNLLAQRVRKLLDAVKIAREQANSIEITDQKIGDALFGYIFQK